MTDAQVVKRAKYKSSVKDPGIRGILKMPNDPSLSVKLNEEFRLIKGHKSSKEGANKPALLNLIEDQGNYIFEFGNFSDREICRDFVGEVGYKHFFKRALLETSDYLKDDCLKINCTVGIVVFAVDCPRLQHSIKVPELTSDHISVRYSITWKVPTLSSMWLEKFHAHKLVLAARSPVFRSVFFT
ncbi:putative chromatin remodeling & transcription regulator BTB-POZ family [Helianthus debilis subsp. tardiflorus]